MGALVFMTIPGLVLLVIAGAFVEVAYNRVTGGRRLLPWQKRNSGTPISAVGFEQLTAIFQGSKHIEFEQRLTTRMVGEDEDAGAPPRDRVDLASGSAMLVKQPKD